MAVRWLLFAALAFVEQGIALGSNGTESVERCQLNTKCVDGIVLPMWGEPGEDVSVGIRVARAFVYLVLLMYFFLGVSIIADRFMAAIEIITSKEKDITVMDKKTGKVRVLTVKIWNETVSNLTLMALGSSAPEILLTVIEVCGKNFEAGELGPSTIVGSAAFNLFVIIAICVYSIPCDDHRQIKHLQVFAVTATCSLFAYVWLYIIVAVNTKNVITVWEGLLTFSFFPLLVLLAWGADRKFNFYRYMRKRVRRQKRQGVVVVQTGDYDVVAVKAKDGYGRSAELDGKTFDMENGDVGLEPDEESELLSQDLTEERRLKAIQVIRDIRQKNPDADKETIDRILEKENLKAQPKSRAFYRIEATRKMVGSGSVLKAKHDKLEQAAHSIADVDVEMNELEELEKQHITRVQFDPPHYTCIESCGSTLVTVLRAGGDDSNTVYVDFKTEDGTAKSGEDYDKTEGTLCFKPGETVKTISLTIIDDDIFEEDEHFTVRLSNIRMAGPDGQTENYSGPAGVLGKNAVAVLMILDDDYPGVFTFLDKSKSVPEADRRVLLEVARQQGSRGIVRVPYHTMEGTAKGGGEAFEDAIGELEFANEEYNKQIEIVIVDDEDYEKRETFQVYLGQPYVVTEDGEEPPPSPLGSTAEEDRIRELGKPRLGDIPSVEVSIIESKEFKNTVDRLLAKANLALVVGTSSWREQFVDAFTVGGDDDDGDDSESAEPSAPTYGDYLMHYLTLFWKVLFATVPPTDIWSGWACFTVSIVWIGVLTMFIGDIASSFGCTIGLSDSVVAISFVALGTSVPDTFASKVAAMNDEYADSSIGNVTGSNSVNVFLGVGLAWSLAAIVHAVRGTVFKVEAGSLGFSVMVFCIFAVVAIGVLMLRRHPAVGGVLGGPMKFKLPTTIFLVFLWIMYIILSSLEAYCHFQAF